MMRSEASAAHQPVHVVEPGGQPRQVPVALVAGAGKVDGRGQRRVEGLEAGAVLALFGEVEQALFGLLDLAPRRLLDGGVVGDVDHGLADADERTAQRQVVDRAAVVLGIDDAGASAARRAR